MKNYLIILFCWAAWLLTGVTNGVAQSSVYTGAFAFGEGDLNTLAKQQTVTNFVNDAQKDVSIVNIFTSWTSGSSTNGTISFPTVGMDYIRSHGSIPLFTWQPQNANLGVVQSFTLANILNGVYDIYITNMASSAKSWGHPFFLRLAHEMNGDWYPWGADVNGNTPSQYVQMWRHVHDIFTGVGATNVTWVWCVNVVSSSTTPIDQLYPGDNYVDWIALDGYNRLANPWQDFSIIATPTVTQLVNIAPGKPIMVSETGCNQNPANDKGKWFLNALTNYLPVVQPRIKAWVYFNSTNTSDGNEWRITVPSSAVTGYQNGIALSYYATNQYGTITSSPIQPLTNDATTTDTMAPFVSIVSPATDLVTNGTTVKFLALASDKSGISKVVFSVNGVPQQTNTVIPYQYLWAVPALGVQNSTITAIAYDNVGNAAASSVQVFSPDLNTVNLVTSDALDTSSFNTAGNWDSGQPPESGHDYIVGSAYTLRTPTNNAPFGFMGDSLTVMGVLSLKTTNVITIANLRLTNGTIANIALSGGSNVGRLSGNISVITNGIIDAGGSASMQILSSITGAGGLTVQKPQKVIFSGTNTYSGSLTLSGTTLEIDATGSLFPSRLVMENYIGTQANNTVTNIVRAGGSLNVGSGPSGLLRVGYRDSSGTATNCVAVLDVSVQPQFALNVGEFSVGNNQANDTFTTLGSVYLATNNSVTATNVLIGFSGFSGGGTNYMMLGSGSNYFNTPVMTVGGQKENARLNLPVGGVFRLDNSIARTDLAIGSQNFGTSISCGGVMDLSGGTFIATLGTMTLGQKSGGNTGGASGALTIGSSGANDVNMNSLVIGSLTGAPSGAPTGVGTLSFGGGHFFVKSNVTLAVFTGSFGSSAGTLNVNGGRFDVAGNIASAGGVGNLNVNAGLIDLMPVGDSSAGSISVDSLLLNGVITNVLNVTVSRLSGSGIIVNQSGVTAVSGYTTPGGSNNIGNLTVGMLVLSGSTVMELNRTNYLNADRLTAASITLGGTLTVTNMGDALQAGDSFQLFSGVLSGVFVSTNLPVLASTNLCWDASKLNSQGILTVMLKIAPSPIISPSWNGTNFTVQVSSEAGFDYVLQTTPGLVPASWMPIQTNMGGGLIQFTIPANVSTQQFFRVNVQ